MEQAGFPILTGTGMHITQRLNCLGQTCKTQYIREGLPEKVEINHGIKGSHPLRKVQFF